MPSSVHARRQALRRYDIFDRGPERAFDRIAEIAARLLDVPMAAISFIDADRESFKACVGFSSEALPREASLGARVLGAASVFVVDDTQAQDVDWAPSLVSGAPHARFYAAAPIATPDGHRIGVLSVMDSEPRSPSTRPPGFKRVLRDLADTVTEELEHRQHTTSPEVILESIPDAFFALDTEWRFTYLNAQAEALLERSCDELLGQNVWDEFPDAVSLDFYEKYHEAVRENEATCFEAYFPPLDTWFRVHAHPHAGGLSVYFDDVTDLRQTRKRLRMLAQAVEQAGDAVVITGAVPMNEPGPPIVYVNEAFERMTGYAAEEIIGRSPRVLQGPETNPEVLDDLRQALDAGRAWEGETVNYRKDGRPYTIEWNVAPVRDEEGSIEFWVSTQRDVTARRAEQRVLRQREEQLSITLRSIGDAVIATDRAGRVSRMNPVAERLTGWAEDEAHGQPLADVLRLSDTRTGAPIDPPSEQVLRTNEVVSIAHHTLLTARDGTERQIADSAAPIRAPDGELLGTVLVFRDVTTAYERRRELQRERDLLASIFDASAAAIIVLDTEGQIIRANSRAEEVLGLSASEAESRTYDDPLWRHTTVEGDPVPDDEQPFLRVMETESPVYDVEQAIEWPDGRRRILSISGAPLRDEQGQLAGAVFVVNDITERKRDLQHLEESRLLLQESQKIAHLGHWTWHVPDGTITWSDETYRIFGLDPQSVDVELETYFQAIPEEERDWIRAVNAESLISGHMPTVVHSIRRPDGSTRIVELSGLTMEEDDEGRPRRIIGTVLDVTRRNQQEQALERAAQRAHVLYEMGQSILDLATASPAGIAEVALEHLDKLVPHHRSSVVTYDFEAGEGEIIAVRTPEATSLTKRRRLPLSFFQTSPPLQPDEIRYVPDITDPPQSLREKKLDAVGVRSYMKIPFVDDDEIVGTLNLGSAEVDGFSDGQRVIAREVASMVALALQQARYREGLVAAKERAEEAERLKSALLANMSHEIRTPLTSIVGFTEVLEEMDIPDEPDRFVDLIYRSSQRLMNTLDSVLSLSQLEAGVITLAPERIDVATDVRSVVDAFQARAAQESIQLSYDGASPPLHGVVDPAALHRVVTNLVSNALKFTSEGGQVRVDLQTDADDLVLTVCDTGIGIGDDFLPHLFDAFKQESEGTARQFEGTGLGLAITHRLVQLLDGDIAVESEKGRGTTFTVRLPRTE